MTRAEILDKAKEIVTGNREEDYGSPEDNFRNIAALWGQYLNMVHSPDDCNYIVTQLDVANMMILLKIARNITGSNRADNWVDICGYSACGGEIETKYTEDK